MSEIERVFRAGHKALIAYLTTGYPDRKTTIRAAAAVAERGCDMIELGIPFSDPLADGATIQKASYRALQKGITPETCMETAAEIRKKTGTALAFMSYFNPILNYGLKEFCRDCTRAGVGGLIVPDLPPEEGLELEKITRKNEIDLIYLLAPTSTESRIEIVASSSRGFIYLVSLAGVTGTRDKLDPGLEEYVNRVRDKASLPLCIGFGIASAQQAAKAASIADGVIIGSKLIELIEEDATLNELKKFISDTRNAMDT